MFENVDKFGKEGLTFDDVLLIPGESDVTPNMIKLSTRLARNVMLNTSTRICPSKSRWRKWIRSSVPKTALSSIPSP